MQIREKKVRKHSRRIKYGLFFKWLKQSSLEVGVELARSGSWLTRGRMRRERWRDDGDRNFLIDLFRTGGDERDTTADRGRIIEGRTGLFGPLASVSLDQIADLENLGSQRGLDPLDSGRIVAEADEKDDADNEDESHGNTKEHPRNAVFSSGFGLDEIGQEESIDSFFELSRDVGASLLILENG